MQSRFLALLCFVLSAPAFAAAPSFVNVNFKPGTQSFELYGEKSRTLYREEQYETTCYREEYTTTYREVCDHRESCDYRDVQSCSSHPVCRDVNRPVCNSQGCTDYWTRECTTQESCTSSREPYNCRTETYNCRQEPYTTSVSVPYSCIQTRYVPYGTELTDKITANITLHFTGEISQESAAESFKLAVANGLDTSAADFSLVSTKSSNDYLLVLREISPEQRSRSGLELSIRREFEIRAFSVKRLIEENSLKMTRMYIDRKGIDVDLEATSAENLNLDLHVQRDRLVGSHLTVFQKRLPKEAFTVTPNGANYKLRVDFAKLGGIDINSRPHLYGLTITMDWKAATPEGSLLNPAAGESLSTALKTSKVIRADVF